MKRQIVVLVVLATLALPASAAVQYTYVQKSANDASSEAPSELTARATIDGNRSRVDFLSGNAYPPGTYAVSTDGSRRLYFVDPVNKWYTEVNTAGLATTLGAGSIRIANFKSEVAALEDDQVIAGINARHQRLTLSYDITVTLRSIPLTQRVTTEIDSWTTDLFKPGDDGTMATQFRTGNVELDALIEAETTRITGFPLRQIVTTKTYFDSKVRSKVEVPKVRTLTREMIVTSIKEVEASPTAFMVPTEYRRSDQPELSKAAATLEFGPPQGQE
jgi:hypothetical protein